MMPAELTVGPGGPGDAPRQMPVPACQWAARPGPPPPQLLSGERGLKGLAVPVLNSGQLSSSHERVKSP